jgi:pyruvate dehydrogenase E2 component (dihydrolipoamide acetyltransferase)
MTAGTIASWLKKEGDSITAGESIAEVETDKASIGFEAQDDSYVAKIIVPAGIEVKVGTPILITVDDQASVAAFKDYVVIEQAATASPPVVSEAPKTVVAATPPVVPPAAPTPVVVAPAAPIIAAPVAPVIATPVAPAALPPPVTSEVLLRQSVKWNASVAKSVLSTFLSNEQAKYVKKYGRSSHAPISK